jgi:hypothetical protein
MSYQQLVKAIFGELRDVIAEPEFTAMLPRIQAQCLSLVLISLTSSTLCASANARLAAS